MAVQEGQSGTELTSARAALTARDADLAEADRLLVEVVAAAHAVAAESIARIEAIKADIDAVASGPPPESPAAAHDVTRLLAAKQREVTDVVNDARAAAEAKTVVLQNLIERYRHR